MSIISYAQNLEDVMLWRALKDVENGFYIDIGANDPEDDSVTKLFYDNGWSGINIEPLDHHYADLSDRRPRDINLKCAAGSTSGELRIWKCDIRGWATMDENVVATHEENGYQGTWHKVAVKTLSEICNEHVSGDIHFLKIDVEGFEKSVIEGLDLSKIRPWIIVIEATKPATNIENHDLWEHLITEQAYQYAYSDGLNRFYVAIEKKEIINTLKYPPNVFDEYITKKELLLLQKAQEFEAKYEHAEARMLHAESTLITMKNSISWQITKPLRVIDLKFKAIKSRFKSIQFKSKVGSNTEEFKIQVRNSIKYILLHIRLYLLNSPNFRRHCVNILKITHTYNFGRKIYGLLTESSSGQNLGETFRPFTLPEGLNPNAKAIYRQLKLAIEQQKEK